MLHLATISNEKIMAFEKGKSGNPSGKKKGTKNKATNEFKEHLNKLLEESAPKMVEWLEQVDSPEKRFEILSRFAEFIHPKLARTEVQNLDEHGEKTKPENKINIIIDKE